MGVIKMLCMCILCGGTTSLVTKKKFGYSLPLTFMSMALIMELVALLFGRISPSYIIIALWAFVFPILACYRILKNKEWKEVRSIVVTPALFATIIFILVIAVFDSGAMYSVWDEYSHWGPMVKVMWDSDKLYCLSEAQFAHHDYPPVVSLFELLICRLVGGYYEAYVYRALHLLSFSLLLPIIEELCTIFEFKSSEELKASTIKTRRILDNNIALIIALIVFLSIFISIMPDIFNCVYTDALLGIEGAVIMWMFWKYDFSKTSTASLAVYISFLLMSKQMGLTFFILSFIAGVTLFVYSAELPIKKRAISLGVVYVIPIIVYEIYHIYTSSLNLAHVQFATNSLSANLVDFILGRNVQEHQTWVVGAMTHYVITEPVTWIGIPYIGWLGVFVIGGFAAVTILAKSGAERRTVVSAISVLTICGFGFFLFALVMLALYIAGGFTVGEVYGLASISRYLCTYIVAAFNVLFGILMYSVFNLVKGGSDYWKRVAISEAAVFAAIVLLLLQIKAQPDAKFAPAQEDDLLRSIRYQAEQIEQVVGDQASIYIISQEDDGYYYGRLNYYLLPNTTDWKSVRSSEDQQYSGEVLDSQSLINAYIKGFDYLYLYNVNDTFVADFAPQMGLTNVDNGSLYKINYNDDMVTFTQVEL